MYRINEQLKRFMEKKHELYLMIGEGLIKTGKQYKVGRKIKGKDSEKRNYTSKSPENNVRG